MSTWLILISLCFLVLLGYWLQEVYTFVRYDDERSEAIRKVIKSKSKRFGGPSIIQKPPVTKTPKE